jgi:hypothetical protein
MPGPETDRFRALASFPVFNRSHEEEIMKQFKRASFGAVMAVLALNLAASAAWAGAVVTEFEFTTEDYNNCTDEMQTWDVVIKQVELSGETPGGRGLYASMWVWNGTVEGQDTGYLWRSAGTSPYMERYALDGSSAGGYFVLENSVMHPLTSGAPRVRLDVVYRMAFNANGDLVVDQAEYTYHCPH